MERQNILNFMTNNKELLLVHTSMYNVRLEHPINIMLTPQFYTVKKEAIPVKYAYQAKKIAPSLFDGLLEEDGKYDYIVFKEKVEDEESWVFIAYNIEKIIRFLESKGIDTNKVSKVFFIQQAITQFGKASLSLGDTEVLSVIDNTVVVIPRIVFGEDNIPSLRFTNEFTPKDSGISIKSSTASQSTLMTQTQAFTLITIFMLFAGMFIVEGSRYSSDTEEEKVEIESIYQTYPYLQSTYTRQDAIDTYKNIDRDERRKRDVIKTVSSMIFKGVTLTSLKIDEKKIISEFLCSDTMVSTRIKELVKKLENKLLTAKGDTKIIVEGTL